MRRQIKVFKILKSNKYRNYKIVEFRPEYRNRVIEIVGKGLMELGVIPKLEKPLNDEDLYKIPKVYKERGRFWVAVENDRVIGTVAIRDMGSNVAKLKRMFVLSSYHGTGIGQALLNHAIKFTKQQGYKEIILNTHLLMKGAHHFYEKNGFKKVGKDLDKYHYRLEL